MNLLQRIIRGVFSGSHPRRTRRTLCWQRAYGASHVAACICCEPLERRLLLTTKFFDDQTLALTADNNAGISELAVPIFYNNVLIGGANHQLVQANDQVPGQPTSYPTTFVDQQANLFARGTYQKSNGTTGVLATSVVGSTSFRLASGQFDFIPTVTRGDVSTGGTDRYHSVIAAQFGSLATITSSRTFPDPVLGSTTYGVNVAFTANSAIPLATASPFSGNDRFRVLTVSSMFLDSTRFDANSIRVQDGAGNVRSIPLDNSTPKGQDVFSSPIEIGSWFELQKTEGSVWNPDSPTVRVNITNKSGLRLGLQAFLAQSTDPNDDSLSVWLEWLDAPDTIPKGTSFDVGFQVVNTAPTPIQAPAITSANATTLIAGVPSTFAVTATGAPGPSFSNSGTLPAGLVFNTGSGVLSGTPAAGTAGVYPLTFTAANGVGSTATQNFTLTISAAPVTNLIVLANDQRIREGLPVPAATFSAFGFNPGDNVANSLTGTATFVYRDYLGNVIANPTAPGTYSITVGGLTSNKDTLTFLPGTLSFISPNQYVTTAGNPTAAGNPTGVTEAFFLSADGTILEQKFNANGSLSGTPTAVQTGAAGTAVSAVTLNDGSSVLFVLGGDTQVYKAKIDAAGNVTGGGFSLVQAGGQRALVGGADVAGNPLLIVIGGDGKEYFQRYDATGALITGFASVNPLAVANAISASGPLLFVQGLDNVVYETVFNGTGWDAFTVPGPGQQTRLNYADGLLLVIGGDTQLYSQQFDPITGVGSGYVLAAPGGVKAISQGVSGAGSNAIHEAFAVGLDNNVYRLTFNTARNPNPAGYSLPAVVSTTASFAVGAKFIGGRSVLFVDVSGQLAVQNFDGAGVPSGTLTTIGGGLLGG